MTVANYKCPCGFIYPPEPESQNLHSTEAIPFEDLQDDWLCPYCGYEKEYFNKVEKDASEKGTD